MRQPFIIDLCCPGIYAEPAKNGAPDGFDIMIEKGDGYESYIF